MNERQKVNKIIHTYVEVNKCEDYTDYKGLITALINWKNEQLTLTDVSQQSELLIAFKEHLDNRDEKGYFITEYVIDEFIESNLQWHNGLAMVSCGINNLNN